MLKKFKKVMNDIADSEYLQMVGLKKKKYKDVKKVNSLKKQTSLNE